MSPHELLKNAVPAAREGITIRFFAPPMVACDPRKTWKFAAERLGKRMKVWFGNDVKMEFVELFSPESFSYPDILGLVEREEGTPPFVTVNGKLIQSGGKLSERLIRAEITRLVESAAGYDHPDEKGDNH